MISLSNKQVLYLRRIVQGCSVFLLIFIIWNTRYPLKNFINPEFYFLIDPLAMAFTSVAERVLLPGLISAGIVLLLTFILGRAFCGWICPLGALFDFWALIKRPYIKLRKKRIYESGPGKPRYVKYYLLGLLLAGAFFGFQFVWFFDPITIFVRTFSFNIHPAVNGAIDSGFMHLLNATDFYPPIESVYNFLRESFLSVSVPRFPHTGVIFIIFATLLLLALFRRRFWCRYICPLGGLLAIPARWTRLRRTVYSCTGRCSLCRNECRMNAIRRDNTYAPEECILCMDCTVVCPSQQSAFTFKREEPESATQDNEGMMEMTRKQFTASLLGFASLAAYGTTEEKTGNIKKKKKAPSGTEQGIRPPGSLPVEEFTQRCIRCGNCMKVCPTNVLQPSMFKKGIGGLWTPVMDSHRGYCEYQCNLCGRVCPTDAIEQLTLKKKQKTVIGMAVINEKLCLPYEKGTNCLVCEEHCPVGEKAIRFRKGYVKGKPVKLPYIDRSLCIGCVICENKCPVEPERAIKVLKIGDA